MKKIKLLLAAVAAMVGLSVNAQSWTGNEVAAGTYFLYNVGAAKFLNNGDPNQNWGTNAYLQEGFGMDIKLEAASGENEYNLNTNVSNGNNNNYLANSTWCDGAATAWKFRLVEGETNTYQIINNGQYLMANEALNDVEMVGDPGSRVTSTYWKLVTENDFKAAMVAKAYSATDPMDVSIFIKGRSFARNDGRNSAWKRTYENSNNQKWIEGSDGSAAKAEGKYYGNEFWNQTFDIHQEITGLPDGTYEVQCSGFGSNGTALIYGNTKEGTLTTANTDAGGSRFTAYRLIADENAWAGQTTGTFTLSGGNLTVGLKRTTNKSADWCVYDEFRLYYYGLDLSEFAATLADAVADAEAVEGTVPAAAYNALAAVVTEYNKTYTTAADYTAAANAIVEATNTAKAMQDNFSRYNTTRTAALAISENVVTTAADAAVAAATTNDAINAAVATLREAFLAELSNVAVPQDPGYIDVTSVMVDNASVSSNTDYWTTEGTWNGQHSFGVCNFGECEFYNHNFKFYQTLPLNRGTWEFGVTGFHRAGNHNTHFYAGEDQILIPGVASDVVNTMAQAKDYFDAGNGKVALKFVIESAQNVEIGIDNQDTQTDKWTIFRDFTLKYYGAPDYSVYASQWTETVTAANGALDDLTYNYVSGNERTAVTDAIADAPDGSSKANYLEKIQALEAATATFKAAAPSYNAWVLAKNSEIETLPYASAAKKTAIEDVVNAPVVINTAAAADAQTNAYNQAKRQYVESNALAEGVVGAIDVTNLITNPNADENADGWSGGFSRLEGEQYTQGDGTLGGGYFDKNGASSYTAEQTISNLPRGKYLLTITARAQSIAADGYKVKAVNSRNDEFTASIPTIGNQGGVFGRGFNDVSVVLEQDYTGDATIGITASNDGNFWLSFDRIRLVRIADSDVVLATAEDYALLNGNLDKYVLGFEAGEFAPYNNNNSTLVQAIAAAKAIDQDAENSQADVQAAAEAITNAGAVANLTEVNGFYDGFFTIQTVPASNTKPLGWNRNSATAKSTGYEDTGYQTRIVTIPEGVTASNVGMMTKMHAFYGDQENYTLPLKANTYYIMTFKYAGYDDQPTIHINVYSEDGTKVDGSSSVKTKDNKGHQQASGWSDFTYIFKTTDAGNYVIGIIKDSGATDQKQVVVTDLNLVKAPTVDVTMSITSAKYATFIAPFDVEIPVGVAAYGVQSADEDDVLTLDDVETTIPANTPVILKSESVVDEVFSGQNIATKDSYTVGWLTGVYTDTPAIEDTYVLQKQDEVVGFYHVETAGITTVNANRAYLTVPSGGGVKAFFLNGGDADGIKSVFDGIAAGKIFDLSGRKVVKMQKGNTYVVNGKKVNVK